MVENQGAKVHERTVYTFLRVNRRQRPTLHGVGRWRKSLHDKRFLSGQGESRTHDTRIFSPLLYCLSYLS